MKNNCFSMGCVMLHARAEWKEGPLRPHTSLPPKGSGCRASPCLHSFTPPLYGRCRKPLNKQRLNRSPISSTPPLRGSRKIRQDFSEGGHARACSLRDCAARPRRGQREGESKKPPGFFGGGTTRRPRSAHSTPAIPQAVRLNASHGGSRVWRRNRSGRNSARRRRPRNAVPPASTAPYSPSA